MIKNAKFIKKMQISVQSFRFHQGYKAKSIGKATLSVLRSALMKHISTEKESVILFCRVGQPMANAFMGMGQRNGNLQTLGFVHGWTVFKKIMLQDGSQLILL